MRNTFRAVALVLLTASWFNPALAAEPLLRIVVPSPAGGTLDVVARTIGSHLATSRKHPVVVENKPGADSAIASEYTIQAKPAGSTLLFSASFLALGAAQGKFRFDPLRDLEPVIKLSRQDVILLVRAELPIRSLDDLIRYAHSGQPINCGGTTGQMYLACQQLRTHLGQQLVAVPFQGIPQVLSAIMGGHLDIGFTVTPPAIQPINAGRLRALAAVGQTPLQEPLSNLPKTQDTWPDIDFESYYGIYVAAGAAPDQVRALNAELNRILNEKEVIAFFEKNGITAIGGSPEPLVQTYMRDIARFDRIKHLLSPEAR